MWQIWRERQTRPEQWAPKRHTGRLRAAPVVVRKLWHARGVLQGDHLEGLVTVPLLGELAVLHDSGSEVHLPRATAGAFAGHLWTVRVPAAMAV